MANVTITQFAEVLKVPVEKLLTQLDEAGIKVSGSDDRISDDAKLELLTHLRRSHGQDESAAGDAAPRPRPGLPVGLPPAQGPVCNRVKTDQQKRIRPGPRGSYVG